MNIWNKNIRTFAYDLSVANDPIDVFLGWNNIKSDFEGFKAIVTLDGYNDLLLQNDIIKMIEDKESGFATYFNSHKLYFVENNSMNNMIENSTVNIRIDYSIMFDTNFASYIDKFVRTGNPGVNLNHVYNTIDLLIKNEYQYDYNVYLAENIKTIDNYFEKDSNEIKITEEMYENMVSIELFKSIKSDVYRNTGKIEYNISYDTARLQAIELINKLYKSSESKLYFRNIVDIQKQMLLNLIGMVKVQFTSNHGPRKKMEDFFKFIETTSGIYFDREVRVAYEYFDKNNRVKIFRRINKETKSHKLYKLLDNIAWDFAIPRFMEHIMTTCGEGDFFIPILLSIDEDLRSMLNIYPVKGFIFNKKNYEFFSIPEKSSIEYFKERKCEYFINRIEETREERKKILQKNREDGYSVIEQQFNELKKLLINGK